MLQQWMAVVHVAIGKYNWWDSGILSASFDERGQVLDPMNMVGSFDDIVPNCQA